MQLLQHAYKILSFLLFIIAVSSCGKKDKPTPDEPIMPLAVGNRWNYEQTTYYNGSTDSSKVQVTMVADSTITYNNNTYYCLSNPLTNQPRLYNSRNYLRNVDNSTLAEQYYSNTGDEFTLAIKSTTTTLTQIYGLGTIGSFPMYDVTYSYPQMQIVNGYSCFVCKTFRTDDIAISSTPSFTYSYRVYYYSKGVGLVQYEQWIKDITGGIFCFIRLRLKSYSLM